MRRFTLLFVVALSGAACTTLPGPPLVRDSEGCGAWGAALDATLSAAGVADAEAERIDGVSGLRVDRIAQALGARALQGDAAWAEWLERAAQLDRQARRAEIDNLPVAAFPVAGEAGVLAADRPAAHARTDRCREWVVQQLRAGDASRAVRAALVERAVVPDRYSTPMRTLGVYPLVRWPFFAGVQAWQDAHAATMRRWAASPPTDLQAHAPEEDPAAGEPTLQPVAGALGLPLLAPAQAQRLLAWHAPVFEVEERGAFDRFGVPTFAATEPGAPPRIDATRPVVYTRLSYMRLGGRWLPQLVYTLWFPERPARSSFDLLAGALDGVIVRLTLDEAGEPLLMDTIHACGCYHLFFPSAALRARAEAPRSEEWMFSPAPLPPGVGRAARLVVRLASSSHYVSGLAAQPRAAGSRPAAARGYALRDERELRSLPLAGGPQRRSLYGPDGLVEGSERGERFLFWPMGIASAGAMRQWGHHATAFVGRRHFDEVDLIERRFVHGAGSSPPQPPPQPGSVRPEP